MKSFKDRIFPLFHIFLFCTQHVESYVCVIIIFFKNLGPPVFQAPVKLRLCNRLCEYKCSRLNCILSCLLRWVKYCALHWLCASGEEWLYIRRQECLEIATPLMHRFEISEFTLCIAPRLCQMSIISFSFSGNAT